MALAWLGSGVMRLVNIGLLALLAGAIIFAAIRTYNEGQQEKGRQEVITEVEEGNEKLEDNVTRVNETIVRRVTNETVTIDRRSRQIEDVIDEQPSEPITNVTKSRLDIVREQQGYISKADSQSN